MSKRIKIESIVGKVIRSIHMDERGHICLCDIKGKVFFQSAAGHSFDASRNFFDLDTIPDGGRHAPQKPMGDDRDT